MTTSPPPDSGSHASARRSLCLTKAALLLIGLGMLVAGKRISTWPIQTWPMYSTSTPTFPPPLAAMVELRVVDGDGDIQRLAPWDLFPFDGSEIAATIFEHAFEHRDQRSRDADRTYLMELINRRRGGARAEVVQGWRLEWTVAPLAVPPLHRDAPTREVFLGSFSASHYNSARGP